MLHPAHEIMEILIVAVYAVLRMFGGRSDEELKKMHVPFTGRVWKRFIAPSYLGLSILLLSLLVGRFHLLYLLFPFACIGGAYMDGYGNDSGVAWREVTQRVLSAFASTAPCIVLCIVSGNWGLTICQLVLAITVKVTLNFVKVKAPIEEGIINFFDSVLKPFLV